MAVGLRSYPVAWLGLFRPRDRLAAAVGDMLFLGFYGFTAGALSARLLARQVRRGQVGGVFFVAQNVGSEADVKALLRLFRADGATPLLAIDHEGGIVQRLTEDHGFSRLPAARDVAAGMSTAEAQTLYARAGRDLAALGFNVNFGPVVDLDNPDSLAIGAFGRAYGTTPERISSYATAFVDGFASAGIICTAKHFPGHGHSTADSHHGVADISASWTEVELEPFAHLIASGRAQMVMTGHLRLDQIEPAGRPATVSAAVINGLLRDKLGHRGVVVTDDLDMDAVSHSMGRREAVIQAILAGNDLLMIKNLFGYDPLLPERVVGWVRQAIADGVLREEQVMQAAERVRAMRRAAGLPASNCLSGHQ